MYLLSLAFLYCTLQVGVFFFSIIFLKNLHIDVINEIVSFFYLEKLLMVELVRWISYNQVGLKIHNKEFSQLQKLLVSFGHPDDYSCIQLS